MFLGKSDDDEPASDDIVSKQAAPKDVKKYKPLEQQHSHHKDAVRSYNDNELELFIDNLIDLWDIDKDGFITYFEYRHMPTVRQTDSEEEDGENDGDNGEDHHKLDW